MRGRIKIFRPTNAQLDSQFPFERPESYALGWRRSDYHGRMFIAHSGGMYGFPTYAAILPEERVAVVVLANGPKSARDEYSLQKAIVFEVFDRLLSMPRSDWRAAFLERHRAVAEKSAAEERALSLKRDPSVQQAIPQAYEGCYRDHAGPGGDVVLNVVHGKASLQFLGGGYSAALQPWREGEFRLRPDAIIEDLEGPTFIKLPMGSTPPLSLELFGASFTRIGEATSCKSPAGAER
ncbi:hypothetical protein AA309_29660 [Microvirga vignae]|uniref:Beta-lactamase-related domain-containing protein n=2 Tax=Microvirga vignae TaxID=1225564 RepID=A0A0H1R3T9_9HYPH|nr:hypothetical protein AA309_29660 [Microvirga vignae]